MTLTFLGCLSLVYTCLQDMERAVISLAIFVLTLQSFGCQTAGAIIFHSFRHCSRVEKDSPLKSCSSKDSLVIPDVPWLGGSFSYLPGVMRMSVAGKTRRNDSGKTDSLLRNRDLNIGLFSLQIVPSRNIFCNLRK